ncbi:MAG: DUF6240 domain-containing protein [archaeon]|nr:DUF6240 domain-containing protein [archaeon]
MKTGNIENKTSILNITNQNIKSNNLKKGDILTGIVQGIDNNKVNINFSKIDKTCSLNLDKLMSGVKIGDQIDFEVKSADSDKLELGLANLDKMISNIDVLKSDEFKGLSSKDVFESYDFIESDEDKTKPEQEEKDDSLKTLSKNAYDEAIKKIMTHENYDILKLSLHEFVSMLVDYNNDKLAGIESSDANLVKSLVDNKFEMKEDEVIFPEEIKQELVNILNVSSSLENIDDDEAEKISLDIIKENKTLTLNNVYESKHKALAVKNAEFDVDSFTNDIKKILSDNDIEINNENIEDSKKLITNEIDVTKENINRFKELKESIKNISKEDVITKKLKDITMNGDTDSDVCLETDKRLEEVAKEFNDSIDKVLDNKKILSKVNDQFKDIKRTSLKQINDFVNKLVEVPKEETNVETELTKTLQEARLLFTAKSAYTMFSKGIDVFVSPLKDVVASLKQIDANEKQIVNGAKLNELNENLSNLQVRNLEIYKDNINDNKLSSIEFYAKANKDILLNKDNKLLITNVSKLTPSDIEQIYENNMIESHYTLNGEHSIAKRNINEILDMLGIDNTELNQKCGIILSLSGNEVSEENINKIKAAEEKMDFVMKNLTPKVALSIIEDGVDVSRQDIDTVIELINRKIEVLKLNDDLKIKNNLIDNINNQDLLYDSLADLITSNKMPDEVKDALLGLYKVVNKVNKYSDAGLGILNFMPDEDTSKLNLTLRDVFDATKVLERKQYGNVIDKSIDDAFGSIELITKDTNAKELLDNAFNKIKEKLQTMNKTLDNEVIKEVNSNIKFATDNKEILETLYNDQKEITLEDIEKVRNFEESKTLLKDNVMTNEVLSNNDMLREDIDKVSKQMKNETFNDDIEDEHIKELRRERNKDVKDILDTFENETDTNPNSLDVTKKILESKQELINKIDSINKVLKMTDATNNALTASVFINEELTNVNIYFDNDIDLSKEENGMVISMHLLNAGDIKADVRINNESKLIRINYLTNNEDGVSAIKDSINEILNTFNSSYKVSDITINGKKTNKINDNNNLYIKSMNLKNKLSQL